MDFRRETSVKDLITSFSAFEVISWDILDSPGIKTREKDGFMFIETEHVILTYRILERDFDSRRIQLSFVKGELL